jgi:2,3-bisphosphoglycerate-independent phosphoglycerate mutase
MEDFTSGHISSEESNEIIKELNETIGSDIFQFHPGVSYRHLLVWKNGEESIETTPPHDITGMAIENYLPRGAGAGSILRVMENAQSVLRDQAINVKRIASGKKPANSIWPWGQGRAPVLPKITTKYRINGGMISAVDLLNGIGIFAGLKIIKVIGATGYIDTNYEGKAQKACEALKELDFVFVHVEAPDEMGHEGNLAGKIKSIEDFDSKVVGKIMENISDLGPLRIMALSDHLTPIRIRTHSAEASPFAVLSSVASENRRTGSPFSERAAAQTGFLISPGYLLMDSFIRNWRELIDKRSS